MKARVTHLSEGTLTLCKDFEANLVLEVLLRIFTYINKYLSVSNKYKYDRYVDRKGKYKQLQDSGR